MRDATPQLIQLSDYAPPAFLVNTVHLHVDIRDEHATVRATLAMRRNPAGRTTDAPLVLDGDELTHESASIDGRKLAADEIAVADDRLTIHRTPDAFTLETVVRIDPFGNTKLMGFFKSKDGLFTQCEAEGFRRITWFLDRPDVMARYTVSLHADRARYPVLLSNGNLVAHGQEPGDRHYARWEDPFPKPSYLFAMVAANLEVLEDRFVTASGRDALLQVYVEPGKLDQAGFAMDSLKRSMRWDEQVFGLELDLERFMIVAVGDFNMGAMENKGLNIFNTKYVLARADTATDADFLNVDRVVAHEYFHNWTGNRVTCRDWFQLSLKEGLTVFRDQEYGADTYSRPVQRIQEVRGLRAMQFPEDAGPMAHPIRPQAYMEISNFYTATVYEKGAEVVRMIHTLIGAEAFRRGMDLYFARHDGQAVTCDEFVQAMEDASGTDLRLFRRWYDQAGTPRVDATGHHDAQARTYTLTLRQSCAPTPGQPEKRPLHIPFAVGLAAADGGDVPLRLAGEKAASGGTRVLSLTESEQTFTFVDVATAPVPSLARGFSAPIVLDFDYTEAQLTHLVAHDSDSFNRWEAGQRLAVGLILRGVAARQSGQAFAAPPEFVAAFGRVLADAARDPAFGAEALALPSESYVGEQMAVVDPDAIHAVRVALRRQLAAALRGELLATYRAMANPGRFSPDATAAGRRALRNLCLGYLMELEDDGEIVALCAAQFSGADNMTDAMAALTALANADVPQREEALASFHARWRHEALVLDKWFAVQAMSRLPSALGRVKALMAHADFDIRNPNRARSVTGSFCHFNPVHFHAADGSGYGFLADCVIQLDALNPQVASRLARSMDRWKKFDGMRQGHARAALERIRDTEGLSKDVTEVVTRALA
jgi:aminopeptidase N